MSVDFQHRDVGFRIGSDDCRFELTLVAQGDADAQLTLGAYYDHGGGGTQDYAQAMKLYRLAADQGNANAQLDLGIMYMGGHGVPQDFILAYKWLNLAAAHAPRRERDYFLRLRNAVASKMSPAQIAEGQRLALLWAPGRP